jgi:hypothetical protein
MKKEKFKIIKAGAVRVTGFDTDDETITIFSFADKLTRPNEIIKQYHNRPAFVVIVGDVSMVCEKESITYLVREESYEYKKLYIADLGSIIVVAAVKQDAIAAAAQHSSNGLAIESVTPLKRRIGDGPQTRYITEEDLCAAQDTIKQWGSDNLPRVYRAKEL